MQTAQPTGRPRRNQDDDVPLGVGALFRESADYARSVGDSLEVQVYEALRHLAQGCLDDGLRGPGFSLARLLRVDPALVQKRDGLPMKILFATSVPAALEVPVLVVSNLLHADQATASDPPAGYSSATPWQAFGNDESSGAPPSRRAA